MSNLFKTFSWMFFSPPSSPPPLLCERVHTRCVLAEPQFQMSLSFPTFIIRARMTGAHIISLSFSLATLGTHTRTRTRTLSLSLSLEHNVVPIANRGCLASPFGGLKEKENFSRGHQIAFLIISHFFHFSPTSLFPDPEELISLFDLTNKMMTSVDLYNCRSIQL